MAMKNLGHFQYFGRNWFDKHQGRLLWFLNGPLKRWSRWILRIHKDIPISIKITKIEPNCFFYSEDGKLKVDVRTHDKFSKRIYFAFRPVWWFAHGWDMVIANPFKPEWNFGFDTLTVYPDAGTGATTVDGILYKYAASGDTLANLISASVGGVYSATLTSGPIARLSTAGASSPLYKEMQRGIFLFNTSSIGGVVSAATFSVRGSTKGNSLGVSEVAGGIGVVGVNPASNNSLTGADYGTYGSTRYASDKNYSSFSITGYNDFSLNSSGIAAVNPIGISKFGTRLVLDIDAMSITWANAAVYHDAYMADNTGTTYDPKLVVTYTPYTAKSDTDSGTVVDIEYTNVDALKKDTDSSTATDSQSVTAEITQTDSISTSDSILPIHVGTAWLNGYSYRMRVPVANGYAEENKSFSFPFPGWWLKNKNKILGSNYEDIRVVTEQGYILNHSINADYDTITVDWLSMPIGRTYMYVYYGSANASLGTSPVGTYSDAVECLSANEEVTSDDPDSYLWYVWGSDLDEACLSSANASTFYGNGATFNVGYDGGKWHYMCKFFEGALPLGTISAARFNVYLNTPTAYDVSGVLKIHRILPTANNNAKAGNAWSDQHKFSFPTWNIRMKSNMGAGLQDVSWVGSTGCSTVGTDISNYGTEPTISLSANYTEGYREVSIPTSWFDDWINNDIYSHGILIKDTVESGSNKRAIISSTKSGTKSKRAVFEVEYTSYSFEQLQRRKLTTNTYSYGTFSVHRTYLYVPDENSFAVMLCGNANIQADVFLITPEGRMFRTVKGSSPGDVSMMYNSPFFGLYYDSQTKKYWAAGNNASQQLYIGHMKAGRADGWTWIVNTGITASKSGMMFRDGIVHMTISTYTPDLIYVKYTIATNSWSSPITLISHSRAGTTRALATGHGILNTDVMDGEGEIWLNGSLSDYSTWGVVTIGSEYFHYKAKDTVNNKLTGVTRGLCGTPVGTYAEGTSVPQHREGPTYNTIVEDTIRNCFHVCYTENIAYPSAGAYSWVYTGYVRHNLSDADTVWRDEGGNVLTLPVTNVNERIVQPASNILYYYDGINLLSNGDLIIRSRATQNDWQKLKPVTTDQRYIRISRLPANGTSFTTTLYPNFGTYAVDTSGVEIGTTGYFISTSVGYTGSDGTKQATLRKHISGDFGVNFYDPVTACAINIPYGSEGYSSTSTQGNFDGNGLAYIKQWDGGGALYIQKVSYYENMKEIETVATADACSELMNDTNDIESIVAQENQLFLNTTNDTDTSELASELSDSLPFVGVFDDSSLAESDPVSNVEAFVSEQVTLSEVFGSLNTILQQDEILEADLAVAMNNLSEIEAFLYRETSMEEVEFTQSEIIGYFETCLAANFKEDIEASFSLSESERILIGEIKRIYREYGALDSSKDEMYKRRTKIFNIQ